MQTCSTVPHTFHGTAACRHFLRTLRDHQIAVKMMDESAVEVVREFARNHVEACLSKALAQIKLVGESGVDNRARMRVCVRVQQ